MQYMYGKVKMLNFSHDGWQDWFSLIPITILNVCLTLKAQNVLVFSAIKILST